MIRLERALDDRYTRCGLNADWSVSAWFIGSGPANKASGSRYILDNEDGSYSLVERWYLDWSDDEGWVMHEGPCSDLKYPGMPEAYRADDYCDGHNDYIRTIREWLPTDQGGWGISIPMPGSRIQDLINLVRTGADFSTMEQ